MLEGCSPKLFLDFPPGWKKETTKTVSYVLILSVTGWDSGQGEPPVPIQACDKTVLDLDFPHHLLRFPSQSTDGKTRTSYGPGGHCLPLQPTRCPFRPRVRRCTKLWRVWTIALVRLRCAMAAYALYHHRDALPEPEGRDSRVMVCLCF